jgi:CheY-like chemotaxis protein
VGAVLTDVMMPGMNGVALARALRTIAPRLPIVAASGLHDDVRTEELAAFGVTNVIAKPCTPREVLRALQYELAHPSSRADGLHAGPK